MASGGYRPSLWDVRQVAWGCGYRLAALSDPRAADAVNRGQSLESWLLPAELLVYRSATPKAWVAYWWAGWHTWKGIDSICRS